MCWWLWVYISAQSTHGIFVWWGLAPVRDIWDWSKPTTQKSFSAQTRFLSRCLQSPSPASISVPTSFLHSSLIQALPGDVLGSLPRHLIKGQPLTFSKHHLLVFILALLQVFPNYFVEEHGKHDLGQPIKGSGRLKVKTPQVTSALFAASVLHPALLRPSVWMRSAESLRRGKAHPQSSKQGLRSLYRMQPLLWKTCDIGDKWDLGRLKREADFLQMCRCCCRLHEPSVNEKWNYFSKRKCTCKHWKVKSEVWSQFAF